MPSKRSRPRRTPSLDAYVKLMRAADILPFELVQVYNINTGDRFETYVIEEVPNSGTIALKGAAARKAAPGDLIIVTCFTPIDDKHLAGFKPTIIHVDEDNRIKEDI